MPPLVIRHKARSEDGAVIALLSMLENHRVYFNDIPVRLPHFVHQRQSTLQAIQQQRYQHHVPFLRWVSSEPAKQSYRERQIWQGSKHAASWHGRCFEDEFSNCRTWFRIPFMKQKIADALSTSEQNGHHQGMGESNFDSIHKSITGTFQNSQIIMICWVGNDLVNKS